MYAKRYAPIEHHLQHAPPRPPLPSPPTTGTRTYDKHVTNSCQKYDTYHPLVGRHMMLGGNVEV